MRALFLTDQSLLNEWWDKASAHLEPVVKNAARGEFELSDIKSLCEEKRAMVGIVIEGDQVVLTMAFEFIYYPRITACNIMALGGSHLSECGKAFFVTFKDWCKSMNVTVLEASCSSSMSRLLRRYGFEKTYEMVRCDLITVNTTTDHKATEK